MVKNSNIINVKRPAIWACSAFMLGIVCGVYSAKHDMLMTAVIVLLALYAVTVVFMMFKRVNYSATVLLLCFSAALVYSFFVYSERLTQPDLNDKEHFVSATVLDFDKINDDSIRFEMDKVEIDGEAINSHILVTVDNVNDMLEVGDRITFYAKVYKPNASRNSMLFDYREFLADKKIYYTVYIDSADIDSVIKYADTSRKTLIYEINRFKRRMILEYNKYLSSDAAGIINAITAGDSMYIDDNVYDLYRLTGSAHVLAISGLHVGFIVIFASIITKRLKKYGYLYTFVNLLIIWCYILFAGMSVSAVRAGIFFSLFAVGKMFSQRCNITNIAFITAFIMLAVDPMLLFSVSFQLSFAAVLSLGILSPRLSAFISKHAEFVPANAINSFSVVICAGLGVLLPIAYHYNTVSVVSIAVNLIIVPLYSYIVLFGFLMMAAVIINIPIIISAVAVVTNGLVFISHVILNFVASWKYSYITVPSPDFIIIAVSVILMLLLSVEKPAWIKRKLIPVCSCIFVLAAIMFVPYNRITGTYTASFIDVGQAECSLIVTPYNKTIMVDAGTSYGTDQAAEYTIVPYLLKHGNTVIDYLVISHAHSDHMGEADELIEQLEVKNLIYYCPDDSESFDALKEVAEKNGTNLINMYYNKNVRVDETTYINRVCDYYSDKDENGQSLVIEIKCSENNLLFAGDMLAEGLDGMDYSDNVLIYKAAHHGSVTALSDTIERISPLYSVIFTKEGNTYGLPNEEVVQKYSEFSDVLLTQECGEIRFTFNDRYVKVFKYIT